jgi:hypothetical protein
MERLGAITTSVVQSETAAGPAAERLLVNGRIYQAGVKSALSAEKQ